MKGTVVDDVRRSVIAQFLDIREYLRLRRRILLNPDALSLAPDGRLSVGPLIFAMTGTLLIPGMFAFVTSVIELVRPIDNPEERALLIAEKEHREEKEKMEHEFGIPLAKQPFGSIIEQLSQYDTEDKRTLALTTEYASNDKVLVVDALLRLLLASTIFGLLIKARRLSTFSIAQSAYLYVVTASVFWPVTVAATALGTLDLFHKFGQDLLWLEAIWLVAVVWSWVVVWRSAPKLMTAVTAEKNFHTRSQFRKLALCLIGALLITGLATGLAWDKLVSHYIDLKVASAPDRE